MYGMRNAKYFSSNAVPPSIVPANFHSSNAVNIRNTDAKNKTARAKNFIRLIAMSASRRPVVKSTNTFLDLGLVRSLDGDLIFEFFPNRSKLRTENLDVRPNQAVSERAAIIGIDPLKATDMVPVRAICSDPNAIR